MYITDIEEREEGETPAIVESIRAGLVFRLKEVILTLTKGCKLTTFCRTKRN